MCTVAICQMYMVPIGKGNFFQSSNAAVDLHGVWGQEVSLQFVLQEHVVLRG